MNWSGKKPAKIDPELASLIQSAEERRQRKQKNKGKQQPKQFFQAFVNNTKAPEIDYNFECGCYGTEHPVINNCTKCGRIICELEGERPCPYCGTPILSDETLADREKYEAKMKEMEKRIGQQKWIPAIKRDLKVSKASKEYSTNMIDLETDWFDSELVEIFEGNA
ncbi:Zinc finger, C2HC5-type [Histomonas meleagridis]|uniref:zinc finger protein, C2HC5-type n=1 Tax=Histomonas meleagridis TaxID=135588 RepID=UPI00355AC390|nr:Zinc finger, C2HC5-type [Histomonas meleagridis]KAH0796561.1 zinc finger protein, C2HC5-type [Histomonas meleagridis]